jgi:hypothetical protein
MAGLLDFLQRPDLLEALRNSVNSGLRTQPALAVAGILGKPIAEAGMAGLGWGAGATREASKGNLVDPAPSLYNTMNIYGLGGPAGGLTSGGAKAAPWFSAVSRAVESAPLKSGPNSQWAGWLKNQQGIKQEELDWMGVPEWLESQPGPVTKQQLSDFVRANQVEVRDVVKGDVSPETIQAHDGNVESARWAAAANTKFSDPKWQLPGGENYRELLLTLPEKRTPITGDENNFLAYAREQRGRGRELTADEFLKEEEILSRLRPFNRKEPFKAGHYDEPNVLAHVRFNDRVDASGKKTLFLEEIQSDWHQRGRKEGYGTKAVTRPGALPGDIPHIKSSGVPDATFKSSWPELALKRMIKWAADNGYDQIAWTPGKVQAARYDLSKHLDSIVYQKRGELYNIAAYPKNGSNAVWNNQSATLKDIEDHLGKEMAEKIANGGGNKKGEFNWLEDLDLQVGGEGMKGFYDKMLPNMANKLGKKFGAKVGVAKIPQVKPEHKSGTSFANSFPDAAARNDLKPDQEVWSLPITDAMRSKVQSEGMPLFTGGSFASPGLLAQDEENRSLLGK